MARKVVKADEGQPIDASARLRLPYARLLIPEAEGGYRAEILEFPGCIAEGDDAAEALSELEAAAEDWIEAAMEMGTPIPQPLDEANYSGRLNLRLSKSLHRKAALAADLDGVSLNQFIVTALSEYVGQSSTQQQQGHLVSHIQLATSFANYSTIFGDGPRLVTDLQSLGTRSTALQEIPLYADQR